MPLPEDFAHAYALVCERIIREDDGVVSAVRIVDVFNYTPHPTIPAEEQALPMQVLIVMKLKGESRGVRTLRMDLLAPSGEIVRGDDFSAELVDPKYPHTFNGITVKGVTGVRPRGNGQYWWLIFLEGSEVCRVPFTLLAKEPESGE